MSEPMNAYGMIVHPPTKETPSTKVDEADYERLKEEVLQRDEELPFVG